VSLSLRNPRKSGRGTASPLLTSTNYSLRNHEIDQFNTVASAYLALILWDQHLILDIGDAAVEDLHHDIRPLLDSSWGDEIDRDFKGSKYDTLRDKGIIVWSTVT
jgi:hypothetical protein